MAETPQEVLYEASVRSVARQQAALDDIRSRAGTLLAAAAIATSFLGAEALKDPGSKPDSIDRSLQCPEVIAIGAFVALAVCALAILWPRKFKFRINTAYYLGTYIEIDEPWDANKLQRNLALWLEKNVKWNQPKLDSMLWFFRAGCFLLLAEVVAWLIDLT